LIRRSVAERFGVLSSVLMLVVAGMAACAPPGNAPTPLPTVVAPAATRVEGDGAHPVLIGEPIDVASLDGRIVFDDFEDVYVMDVDGSNVHAVAADVGPEFDGAWSPDGEWIVYRDSRRGINEDDEINAARVDGSERRNLTQDPGNDWGPDWSPDGRTIIFNSDRDGMPMGGFLVNPDGSNLRALEIDAWVEYPAFSPDGTRIVFMGHEGADYDIFTADLRTGAATRLTDARGSDGWPVWSPDGSTIAFASERDDCLWAPSDEDCWRGAEPGEHHDIWLMDADGANQRRLTPEFGQFVAWSPDGKYLLISGYALYVLRPDGTGRVELRADTIDRSLGGIPDWIG